MDFNAFLSQEIFNFGSYQFQMWNLLGVLLTAGVVSLVYWLLGKRIFPFYFEKEKVAPKGRKRIHRLLVYICFLLGLIGLIWSLDLDYVLYRADNLSSFRVLKVTTVLAAVLILQFARLLDWIISKVLIFNYYRNRDAKRPSREEAAPSGPDEGSAGVTTQYVVYIFAILVILQMFQIDYTLFSFENYNFKISNIFFAVLILLAARLIAWIVVQLVLYNYYRQKRINRGSQYAINQLFTYFIYVIAVLAALESLGIHMTVIWGGAAALLVGVGLGLQQTFNDLISGIILLFERTVEVGDVVEIDGMVGTVRKIGLRTSLVETRHNITVIVPNSKLTIQNVINWSHYDSKARFSVNVGVAYGSDTQLVKNLLLEAARGHGAVVKYPSPFVRFTDFGDSSLVFELHFWSQEFMRIEDVQSEIRFEIDRLFRENGITIPFPQRDVWLRK